MEEPNLIPFDSGPVPKEFWSDYAEAPFEECCVCGRSLAETYYEIQKVSNHRETILEMALCITCSHSLAGEYSTQSYTAIRSFLTAHLDLSRPREACTLCGERLAESASFSAGAVCSGQRLVFPPIFVCSSCEEEIQELLSDQTRGAHEDFMNRTFPGVPADLDLAPRLIL
jgi:hypothetical protein